MQPFVYTTAPARIVFGTGSSVGVAEEIRRLGLSRALVLSTPHQKGDAEALAARLGPLAAGVFSDAAMHTPVKVTKRAVEAYRAAGADCVVSLGGGSTTGLGKAIALRTDAPQIVIPTTYAGSEVTPILGQTENGVKTTLRGPEILPEVVIYDAELTLGLPVGISMTSGLNAMAHAAEALYARDRNPIASMMAVEGLRAMIEALPGVRMEPQDTKARETALYGAWLCGTVLGAVGMSLHHKLCHTLGGSLDLPHAETHAVLLPHTIAYVEQAVPDQLAPLAALVGGRAGTGLYDFAARLGAPASLAALGVGGEDLDAMAELATANPYWCPRPVEKTAIRALLQRAFEGARPE
ncbi:maleylacetate reductase [Agrobacterium tumefaciens]|uniref:Maleylacetate reductase n=1 Tax=Agrobacterium tumefaciens TaxID=358 RepID=A0AA44F515_AGRTU|nr:maleylacetate reductase [Agrobacterium tumefaciens]NSL21567.1 maleylacetate reductase [Agrobacterium tumefaciens]NTB87456.1 maleylacetate reductase [Agrobacterium tumefaciens]NTC16688.1 maleylacetate reductase [Agrobacterium tumefaciens]NTC28731.1 maleylacetate reductase [Agrobacterium tumefaciens]NTC56498.1 maleylacetate reductase [Agrobacterium tumefaciens]